MKDKYDEQIEELLALNGEFKDIVVSQWSVGRGLFAYAHRGNRMNGITSGCLTMIRANTRGRIERPRHMAQTEALTREIEADERIPNSVKGITRDNLPIFAEWQRRLDKELVSV